MKILTIGDFKELMPAITKRGFMTTLDPGEDYDVILADTTTCHMAPSDSGAPLIIRLLRKISDITIRNQYPSALFGTTDDEIMRHLINLEAQIVSVETVVERPTANTLITVFHTKGGVGASTTARAVAHGLAGQGIRTILVDFDFRGPNLASYYNLGRKAQNYLNGAIDESTIRQAINKTKFSNMALLALDAKNLNFATLSGELLNRIVGLLFQSYQAVVIDTTISPDKLPYLKGLFSRSNHVLVTINQSKPVLDELEDYSNILEGMGVSLDRTRLVINQYNPKEPARKIVEKIYYSGKANKPQPSLAIPICNKDAEVISSPDWLPAIKHIIASLTGATYEEEPAKAVKLRSLFG